MRMITLLLSFLVSLASAQAKLQAQLIDPATGAELSGWTVQLKEALVKTPAGAVTLTPRIELTGDAASNAKLTSENERVKIKKTASGYLLNTPMMETPLAIKGQGKTVQALLKIEKVSPKGAKSKGCKEANLDLIVEPAEFPFYLAVICGNQGDEFGITLTRPEEVSLTSSSLVESAGKGENYHFYNLGKIQSISGEAGKWTFAYKDKEYNLSLAGKKMEKTKIIRIRDKRPKVRVGPGFNQISVAGGAVETDDAQPGILLKIPYVEAVYSVFLSGDISVLTPAGEADESVSFFMGRILSSYLFGADSDFAFGPVLFYEGVKFDQSPDRISLKHNSVGGGLVLLGHIGDHVNYDVELLTSAFAGESVESAVSAQAQVIYRGDVKKPFGYGLGIQYHAYGTKSATGIQREFNQTAAHVVFQF